MHELLPGMIFGLVLRWPNRVFTSLSEFLGAPEWARPGRRNARECRVGIYYRNEKDRACVIVAEFLRVETTSSRTYLILGPTTPEPEIAIASDQVLAIARVGRSTPLAHVEDPSGFLFWEIGDRFALPPGSSRHPLLIL